MSNLCAVSVPINHPMNNFSHCTLKGLRNNSNRKYVLGMSIIYMPAKSKVEGDLCHKIFPDTICNEHH